MEFADGGPCTYSILILLSIHYFLENYSKFGKSYVSYSA